MTAPQAYRGQRLGLPFEGAGSLASTDRRIAAFVVDCVAAFLVAALFTASLAHHQGADALPRSWSFVPLFADYVIGLATVGRTLGMNLFGLRVVRVDRTTRVSVLDAAVRTILLVLLIPAVIWDRDQRGLHDRLARTAVVRA